MFDHEDVRQEAALVGLRDGVKANKVFIRHRLRRKAGKVRLLTETEAACLRCGRGPATETLPDLEGLKERTFQVARLLAEGHRAGHVQQLLDMTRTEFEARREELRELYS